MDLTTLHVLGKEPEAQYIYSRFYKKLVCLPSSVAEWCIEFRECIGFTIKEVSVTDKPQGKYL